MKVTRAELQAYFDKSLPSISDIADAFTFHAFEVESVEGDTLDVKVLPNRTVDCSTIEGIACELAAILDLPLTNVAAPEYGDSPRVAVTVVGINAILGSDFSHDEVLDVFRRLRFCVEEDGEALHVTAPSPRTDIAILEDVAEEVGQIVGYDRVPAVALQPPAAVPDQARFRGIERMKDQLVEQGFTEVSTQSFTKSGDVELANPMDKTRPFLRTSLEEGLVDALVRAKQHAPLVLAPGQRPKLFEVGSVFPKSGEYLELRMTERVPEWGEKGGTVDNLSAAALEDYGKDYTPTRYELGPYKPFSVYPFVLRDIALWTPEGTTSAAIETVIRAHAGDLLVRIDQFDSYAKNERTSYAFRLVFQAFDRTLTDDEVNGYVEKVTHALNAQKGYEVR
ncbi:MAG: hypothetical protein B7X04_03375 [Parcubacteria group bacterium 21-54-25]|nr:MAG: hypothetical protein B7X04_03375 [Parcubacteria group bacterium 21-54-25]HQU08031.1 hypothetical protein [Candidatus Paceibacterota bacterium]